jgi:hypothetical protein
MKYVFATRSAVRAMNCGTMLLLVCKGEKAHVLMEEQNPKRLRTKHCIKQDDIMVAIILFMRVLSS